MSCSYKAVLASRHFKMDNEIFRYKNYFKMCCEYCDCHSPHKNCHQRCHPNDHLHHHHHHLQHHHHHPHLHHHCKDRLHHQALTSPPDSSVGRIVIGCLLGLEHPRSHLNKHKLVYTCTQRSLFLKSGPCKLAMPK